MNDLVAKLRSAHAERFGAGQSPTVAIAPGRVNLIGEHTDYNDGFVLPMAIDRFVGVAFTPREDGHLRAFSPDFDEVYEAELDALAPGRDDGWKAYVAGVFWAFRASGMVPRGMDLVLLGRVPIGAGLSSSAAVEMAVARAICEASDIPWDAARMALVAQQAERDYAGVSCGIMDQFASAMSSDGSALLLDCRSLETSPVPLPSGVVVVVMDTGVRRTLAGSEYNERYARCQEAVRVIQRSHPEVRALRDVSAEMLEEFRDRMDPVTLRRAEHVVVENFRPVEMAEALRDGHLLRAGRLMNDSHQSLKNLYEVSCPELDWMTELAEQHPDCYGARLTGAGFGGCAIALVERAGVDGFIEVVSEGYRGRFDHPAALFACEAAPGASIVE